MTIITIDMSLGSTGPIAPRPSATPRLLPFPAWFQLRPFCDRMRNRHGRHIAGMNGIFPGSVKAKFGSHQFTTAASIRRSFTLALPIATILPSATDGHTLVARRCETPLGGANDPRGLIVAVDPDRVSELAPPCQACQDLSLRPTASSWPIRLIRHAYAGSGNLGMPSVLGNRHLARSAAGHLMMSRLRL